jgi:hypothetical protein
MPTSKNNQIFKLLIICTIFSLLASSAKSTNTYEYFIGSAIPVATLNDEDTTNSATAILPAGADFTLTKFKSHFQVDVDAINTHILVSITTRGAS